MRHALAVALLLAPAAARAQAPRCPGRDASEAGRLDEEARGLVFERPPRHRHHGSVTRSAEERHRRLIDVGAAECAAGDDRGLVWRAYALGQLGRHLDAARDLDDYLAAHPLGSHDDSQRTFIVDIQRVLAPHVARLRVIERPAGSVVCVGDADVGQDIAYFEPGPAVLTVRSDAHEPLTRQLALPPGTVDLALVESSDVRSFATGVMRVPLSRRTEVRPASPDPAPPDEARVTDAGPRPTQPDAPPRPLRPWAIAATVAAGTFALAGVGFSIWREERGSTYVDLGCGPASFDPTCISTYSQFDTAKTLQLASFVTAGVLAGGAVALWLLDRRDAARPRRSFTLRTNCLPIGLGVHCAW